MNLRCVIAFDRRRNLIYFFVNFGERALPSRPIESDFAATAADLLRAHQGRAGRNAVERSLGRRTFRSFFSRFDLIPLRQNLCSGVDAFRSSEHMWVSVHKLVTYPYDHAFDVERLFTASERGVKYDLQQYVAELLAVSRDITARECIDDFVRFLDEIWPQRVECLLAVPRTAARCQQPVHDFNETTKRNFRCRT